MANIHQIRANQNNAQRSTGPRSSEGKTRCSQNALKHGLTARSIVLHWEDAGTFEQLRSGLVADFEPATETEELLIDQLAQQAWRLRRSRTFETGMLACLHPDSKETHRLTHEDTDHFRRYETSIQRDFYRALDHLLRLKREPLKALKQIGSVSQNEEIAVAAHAGTPEPLSPSDREPEPLLQQPQSASETTEINEIRTPDAPESGQVGEFTMLKL